MPLFEQEIELIDDLIAANVKAVVHSILANDTTEAERWYKRAKEIRKQLKDISDNYFTDDSTSTLHTK